MAKAHQRQRGEYQPQEESLSRVVYDILKGTKDGDVVLVPMTQSRNATAHIVAYVAAELGMSPPATKAHSSTHLKVGIGKQGRAIIRGHRWDGHYTEYVTQCLHDLKKSGETMVFETLGKKASAAAASLYYKAVKMGFQVECDINWKGRSNLILVSRK